MQLMRRSGGGTVAVLAPSGLSYNESAVALGEAFHAQLREQRVGTLGVAFLRARHASAADGLGEGTRAIYNLLGDPALRLGGIMGIDDDAQNFAQWRWNLLAPDELAETGQDLTTGTGGDVGAFAQYAFGVSSTQPSPIRGIQSISLTPDGNVSIDWSRRRQARDLRYRLLVSEDLVYWEEAPPDVETLTQGNTPDGVMENVSSRINRQRSNRLFFRIDVQQE